MPSTSLPGDDITIGRRHLGDGTGTGVVLRNRMSILTIIGLRIRTITHREVSPADPRWTPTTRISAYP